MLCFQHSEEWGRTPTRPLIQSIPDCSLQDFQVKTGVWMDSELSAYFFSLVREISSCTLETSHTEYLHCISDIRKWNDLPRLFILCLPVSPAVWGCNLLPLLQGLETKACRWLLLWANNQKSNGLLYRAGCLCPVLACPQFCCGYRHVIQ